MKHLKIISGVALTLAFCVGRSEVANGQVSPCPPPVDNGFFSLCPPPGFWVSGWVLDVPGLDVSDLDGGEPADVQADCQVACQKWVDGCKGYAEVGKKCLEGTSEALIKKFYKDGGCKTLDDPFQLKACQAFADFELKLVELYTKCQTELAKTCCEDLLPMCLEQCITNSGPMSANGWPESCNSVLFPS